jgi:three-Cys-motif partner protein
MAQAGRRPLLDGHLVESNPDSCAALTDYLSGEGLQWQVYEGDVHEHLPKILDTLHREEASFFFLDPFGLGVPLEMLETIMGRAGELKYGYRTEGAATELLLNFSMPGLWRNAGHLTSKSTNGKYLKARETLLSKVDASMGGPWWQEIWLNEKKGDRDRLILEGYAARLAEVCKGRGLVSWFPCADRWQGPPSYFLVHVTQHPDGAWLFNEAVSSAMEVYRDHCHQGVTPGLFDGLEFREREWIDAIKKNIRRLLGTDGEFTIIDRMGDVYGDTHGVARSKHVRTAVKELHEEGVTSTDGKYDIPSKRIKR